MNPSHVIRRFIAQLTFALMAIVVCTRPNLTSAGLTLFLNARVASSALGDVASAQATWSPARSGHKQGQAPHVVRAVENSESEGDDEDGEDGEGPEARDVLYCAHTHAALGVTFGQYLLGEHPIGALPIPIASRYARGPGLPRAPPLA